MMEPPYAGRHVRWCERSHGELIPMLLLDFQNTAVMVAKTPPFGLKNRM